MNRPSAKARTIASTISSTLIDVTFSKNDDLKISEKHVNLKYLKSKYQNYQNINENIINKKKTELFVVYRKIDLYY